MFLRSLLACWLVAVGWAAAAKEDDQSDVKSITLRTHSLTQPYLDSDMQSRWYDYGGDTIIRTDSYIRLASNRASQQGWLFSRVPLTATNWEIEVEYKIHGKDQLFGDGFAMWITKSRGQTGTVFGSVDRFEGLGLFFDTYKNNRPGVVFPYVMAMMGDGKTAYDKENDGKNTELAGCSARGIRHANAPTKFKLTYFQDKLLKLDLQYKADGEWTSCFELENPPAIPQVAYLGFSAETGELSDNHDIISIVAKNLYTRGSSSGNKGSSNTPGSGRSRKSPPGAKPDGAGGSWTWFLIKVVLLVLGVGGAYVGYTAYRANGKRTHRF